MVGRLFPHHDGRAVQVAVGDARENGAVGQTQALYPDYTAVGIDHGHRIVHRPHTGRAAGVKGAFGVFANEIIQLRVALHIGTGLDFLAGVFAEGVLCENLAG